MRTAWVAALLLAMAACASQPVNPGPPNADLMSLGVDSRSTVESRIGDLKARITVVKSFTAPGSGVVTNHTLTAEERKKFSAALGALAPLQRRIIQEHVRSVSFADGLGANAQAQTIDCGKSCVAFDLIINGLVLKETVSQFTTRKERQLFDATGSTLSVSVDAGSMDALVFVLLHESTHMVDSVLHLTPEVMPGFPIPEASQTAFGRGVWEQTGQPVATYRSPLLDGIFWRSGKTIPVAQAPAYYDDLKHTPFPSSFASYMSVEDLPDVVALWRLTEKFHQPYRIVIRDGEHVVYSYEPMKSPLVRSRLGQLKRLDSTDIK